MYTDITVPMDEHVNTISPTEIRSALEKEENSRVQLAKSPRKEHTTRPTAYQNKWFHPGLLYNINKWTSIRMESDAQSNQHSEKKTQENHF